MTPPQWASNVRAGGGSTHVRQRKGLAREVKRVVIDNPVVNSPFEEPKLEPRILIEGSLPRSQAGERNWKDTGQE